MKHRSPIAQKDEWLTPPGIIKSLGEFDLDPCSPIVRPWPTAIQHYSILDNGLIKEWFGRVWLNPPYGKALDAWMNKMAMHGNGIALTFGRTDTNTFHNYVFPVADSIFFIKQRLTFFNVDGTPGKYNGGAPSVLIGYGAMNSEALSDSGIKGKHVPLNSIAVAVVSFDKTWKAVVHTVFVSVNRTADLDTIYEYVEKIAPEKVSRNAHYKAKVRQTLQLHFKKVDRGIYSI